MRNVYSTTNSEKIEFLGFSFSNRNLILRVLRVVLTSTVLIKKLYNLNKIFKANVTFILLYLFFTTILYSEIKKFSLFNLKILIPFLIQFS